jgi:hypothetical protein
MIEISRRGLIAGAVLAATLPVLGGAKAQDKPATASNEADNKAIVGRWFTEFWGEKYNPAVIDDLAAPDMLLQYSLHAPRRGRDDIKAFMANFRNAFPDLNFWALPI